MSARRVLGLIRSLAIYHGIPLRQPRLRRFYAQFVSPGELVFDLGAHAGNRTRAFAAMGCRTVAVEPQPDFARLLRLFFARSPLVHVIEAAVGGVQGHTPLFISERHPTVTTTAAPWHDTRAGEPDFAGVRWDRRIDVPATTVDRLIERFGVPAFIKIDVEGSEPAVLAGLSQPVRALSFEYLPRALDYAEACTARLGALGSYRYNWSIGESYRLAADEWMTAAEICAALRTPEAQRRPGDVYARLDAERAADMAFSHGTEGTD
jgi:FkbM family methyltransferase